MTIERLPAALFGLAVVAFLTVAAWRLTGSRALTFGTLALTALTPWLVIESRVGFETISWVALLSGALWCLSNRRPTPRQFGIAGVFLAFAIYGYTTARLEVGLIAIAVCLAWGIRRTPGWWRLLVPVALGYVVLAIYALLNPGALTARFDYLNIWADGASFPVVIGRFVTNYFTEIGPRFLFLSGDANPRQNTQIGGMLLWVMVPLLIAGVMVCWERRGEPLIRFLVLGHRVCARRGRAHLYRERTRASSIRDAAVPRASRRARRGRHSACVVCAGWAEFALSPGCSPPDLLRRAPT